MSTEAAQLQFAAECTLFLAAVATIAVTALRPGLMVCRAWARLALVAGAAALAVGAFLHGSLLVGDPAEPTLVLVRSAGIALCGVATLPWAGPAVGRVTLVASLAVLAVAEVLTGFDQDRAADAVRGVGALLLVVGLLVISRQSIAARVATWGAAMVLLVITAVSIALSIVIADNVEDEAARRYGARAETESLLMSDVAAAASREADILGRTSGSDSAQGRITRQAIAVASDPAQPEAERRAATAVVAERIALYRDQVLRVPFHGPLFVVGANGRPAAVVDGLAGAAQTELFGARVVQEVIERRTQAADVVVVGDQIFALGAAPVIDANGTTFSGVAVITSLLGAEYLTSRTTDPQSAEQGVDLALAIGDRIIQTTDPRVRSDAVLAVAAAAISDAEPRTTTAGGRFLVAVPVLDDTGTPFLAVVANVPQDQINQTREDLFRLLFIVALGAALLAMILAGYAGNRIGSGLRALTAATGELQQGRFDARADLTTEDELGDLAATFNVMAGSMQTMTSDLRRAAEDEARLRARLEGVVAGMGEALVAVDADGVITDFNAAAEALVGVPSVAALGSTIDQLCSVRDQGGADVTGRLVGPVVDAWGLDGEVVPRDGPTVPVAVSAGPLRGPGGMLGGAVFVIRDVRREREVEQMKTEFIANVSHELRTPLTPIKGYAEVLARRDVDPDRVKVFAGEIANGARQLERVTDQLVQFAMLAAGRLQLHPEVVPARELVEGAIERWRGRVNGKHELVRRVSRNAPAAAIDRRYVDLAIDELIDNALKYSPDGGRVRISASVHENGHGPHLLVTIDDQGVGITPERRDAIFDDFSQGDGSATRRFGGLGLGLALVSRIVRAHGGELGCTSQPGRGTTVRMLLPVSASDQDGAP